MNFDCTACSKQSRLFGFIQMKGETVGFELLFWNMNGRANSEFQLLLFDLGTKTDSGT